MNFLYNALSNTKTFAFNALVLCPLTNKADNYAKTAEPWKASMAKAGAYSVSFFLFSTGYLALLGLGYGTTALILAKGKLTIATNLLTSPNQIMVAIGSLFSLVGMVLVGIHNKEKVVSENNEERNSQANKINLEPALKVKGARKRAKRKRKQHTQHTKADGTTYTVGFIQDINDEEAKKLRTAENKEKHKAKKKNINRPKHYPIPSPKPPKGQKNKGLRRKGRIKQPGK